MAELTISRSLRALAIAQEEEPGAQLPDDRSVTNAITAPRTAGRAIGRSYRSSTPEPVLPHPSWRSAESAHETAPSELVVYSVRIAPECATRMRTGYPQRGRAVTAGQQPSRGAQRWWLRPETASPDRPTPFVSRDREVALGLARQVDCRPRPGSSHDSAQGRSEARDPVTFFANNVTRAAREASPLGVVDRRKRDALR
jgi:hypothetical protein